MWLTYWSHQGCFGFFAAGQDDGVDSELYRIGNGVSEMGDEVPDVVKEEEEDEPGRGVNARWLQPISSFTERPNRCFEKTYCY